MGTECKASELEFHGLGRRRVAGAFDGGEITSDAGGVALREVEARTHILKRLGGCFEDHRRADRVEHPAERLVKQRVLGICLGYEDLADHDELCRDRLLALLCDCADIDGAGRRKEADRGKPLAGKSTPDRLELTPAAGPEARYKRTVADTAAMDALLVDLFVEAHATPPAEIVLDVDATDDPVHGGQEGRFFSGHYDCYCYLPLYVFCGEHLLCARLRSASSDGAHETVAELSRIVSRIRARWPGVRIAVRAGQRAPGLAVVRAVVAARGAAAGRSRQPADDAAALLSSRAGRASPTGTAGDRACPPAVASRKSPPNTGGKLRRTAASSVFHVERRPGQPAKPPWGKSQGPNPVGCPANARW